MKYVKFNLSDNTSVKFKIRRLVPYGLDIAWKYRGRFNFAKYINLHTTKFSMESRVEFLQQLTDEELINEYKGLIEEEHKKIKNIKRVI